MLKKIIIGAGVLLVILGLFGFFPNRLIGDDGFFLTDIFHDLIHIFAGLVIIFVALKRAQFLSLYLQKIGIIFIALAVLGAMTIGMGEGKLLYLFLLNGYDNILHLIIGTILVILGGMVLRSSEESKYQIPAILTGEVIHDHSHDEIKTEIHEHE